MSVALNHSQVASLVAAVGSKRTVVVEGENGIGKTALFREVQHLFPQHLAFLIDTQMLSDGSMTMPDLDRERGVSRELPNERFGVSATNHRGIPGSRPVLICFDEVLKVKPFIQTQIAPVIYDRRLGIYELPEGSIVMGTTNLGVEGLGDSQLAHMRTRNVFVRLAKPTQSQWKANFALPQRLNPTLIAFTDLFPQVFESFLDCRPGGVHASRKGELRKHNPHIYDPDNYTGDAYASPRTLHAASDILDMAQGLDEATLHAALVGAVGQATAREIVTVHRFGRTLPSVADIFADPQGTTLPHDLNSQVLLLNQLINRTSTRAEANATTQYVNRMQGESKLLFTRTVSQFDRAAQLFLTIAGFNALQVENARLANV